MGSQGLRRLLDWPSLRGPLAGLALGLPILAVGLLVPGRLVIPATVPAVDAASLSCVLVTAAVAAVDALIRADRRSLPTASIGVALAVIWTAHLLAFPGSLPAIDQAVASAAASSVFLAGNLATPLMLAVALLQGGGRLARPGRSVAVALVAGLATGAVVVAAALLLAPVFPTIAATGEFNVTESWVGAAGLVPALVGLGVYLAGWRGDERVSSGVAAALALAACNSIVLFFLDQRYTTAWYADHALALLVTAALLTGQVAIFADALRRETRNTASLRASLEMTEAMARQVEIDPLMERLMAGAMNAVRADRATLMAVDGDHLQIQASIDRRGSAAPLGRRLTKASMRADGLAVVEEAIRLRRAIATGPYDRDLLAPDHAAGVEGVRHYITWPLVLGDEVDAVLFLARRRDHPFDADDAALLSEFATIAALLLRNARLLGAAEAASVAKGNFLNLAAHELRTPVSVIRGYLDLVAGGDLGPVAEGQRDALRTLTAKAEELSRQIDQLLVAARVGAGRAVDAKHRERFDLAAAAREAVARAEPRARLLGATIELSAEGAVPVRGSPTEIGMVLDNLLNNALTYSRSEPRVRVEVSGSGAPLLRIVDHGIGIPADQRALVFEQFHRVDRPDFGYPSGTGLGLSIARQLAAASGGALELEWTELEQGSSFVVRLPAAAAQP